MVSSFALQKVHKCVSFNFILYKNEFEDCLKENLLDIHFDTHDTTDTFVKKIVSNKKAKFLYRSRNSSNQSIKHQEIVSF
jgi:hypothetical protein